MREYVGGMNGKAEVVEAATVDAVRDIGPRIVITAKICRLREFRVRVWIANQLLRLACWVGNFSFGESSDG